MSSWLKSSNWLSTSIFSAALTIYFVSNERYADVAVCYRYFWSVSYPALSLVEASIKISFTLGIVFNFTYSEVSFALLWHLNWKYALAFSNYDCEHLRFRDPSTFIRRVRKNLCKEVLNKKQKKWSPVKSGLPHMQNCMASVSVGVMQGCQQ